jgi:hypothetical protein
MRYMLALATLPVAVIWAATPKAAPPVVAKAIAIEGVTQRRMDDDTFRARWRAVADMPPMIEVVDNSVLLVSTDEVRVRSTDAGTAHRRRSVVSAMASRPASLNICTKHGLRKVTTRGGKSWRCKR